MTLRSTAAVVAFVAAAPIACGGSQPAPAPAPPPPGYYYGPPPQYAYPPPGYAAPGYAPPGYAPAAPTPPAAPAAPPGVGVPCAPEGGYDCTTDRRAMTVCRGGRTAVASYCRGPRGCVVGAAVDCDHSTAMAGDPCDDARDLGCSADMKQMLRCVGGAFRVAQVCPSACLAASGSVLCQ